MSVTDEGAVKGLMDAIVSEFGHAWIWPSTTPGYPAKRGRSCSPSSKNYQQMVETNILGVYYLMKYEIAQMQKQGKGAIVNLASIAGLKMGSPTRGRYASTKHAVVGLTKSAAARPRTGRRRSRQRGRSPGACKTDYIIARELAGRRPNYNEANISAMHPMKRKPRPARGDRERHLLSAVR